MIWLIIISSAVIIIIAILVFSILIFPPGEEETELTNTTVVKTSEDSFRLGNNWHRKSGSGLWELYIEGKPFERGLIIGKLTKELIYRQEKVFVEEVGKIIPSRFYLFFLKLLVAAMNRRLDKYIGDEYCREIHGISYSASAEFSWIGPKYQRLLNYHAAHDIGHILQNLNLVGCTAFSAWGSRSYDGGIITGRNFDFYIGDTFSGEKIVSFYAPEKGYRFASVTWGGMIGTISGMNEHGLAITVNAAKSEFPNHSATPVSIMVREILQYARNIGEAFTITEKRNIFVSESLVVSSAEDKQSVIIEKSRYKTVLLRSEKNYLICTNHFQSRELINDKLNQKYMQESPTTQRYERVEALISKYPVLGLNEFATILRDKKGTDNSNIGLGNEKAVDQLLAHHSIIFKPELRKFWICTGPYPEGIYQAYDLNKIFATGSVIDETAEICEKDDEIPADPFLNSPQHTQYIKYKELLSAFRNKKNKDKYPDDKIEEFVNSNPEMYLAYSVLGDYFLQKKDFQKAVDFYKTGLSKDIPNKHEIIHMQKGLEKAQRKAPSA